MATSNFGLIATDKQVTVPLRKIHVDVTIRGTLASLAAHFHYENKEDDPIEAIFVLPLESGISVCEFKAEIDGRVVLGRVEEKEEAREIYDDAISSGQTAFLMEESMDSDDIFKISVGNLPPKKSAVVSVTAVMTLKHLEDGELHFVLPTILNPRYSPGGEESRGLDNWSQSPDRTSPVCVGAPYSFSLGADIECGSKITSITSPTHQLTTTLTECDAKVTIENIEQFSKDVEIVVKQDEPFKPFAFVEPGDPNNDNAFMASSMIMINYYPKDILSKAKKSSPGEYVFVIDRSGSMSGRQIKDARESLILFLKSLPPKSKFNIISFGSLYDFLYPGGSKDYTNENVSHACQIVGQMEADYGGTEILRPLQELFAQKHATGLQRRVFLITDGEISNTSAVIDLVKTKCESEESRCFALGIGHGASTSLILGVAKAGNGVAEFAREGTTIQQKVVTLLRYASQPCLSNISVKDDKVSSIRQIPTNISQIFSGDSLTIFAETVTRQDNSGITLCFTSAERNFERSISLSELKIPAVVNTIHRCAAKVLISELRTDPNNREDVIKLSRATGILSKFTSYVGIDEGSKERIKTALKRRIVQCMTHLDMNDDESMASSDSDFDGADNDYCAFVDCLEEEEEVEMLSRLSSSQARSRDSSFDFLESESSPRAAFEKERKPSDKAINTSSTSSISGGINGHLRLVSLQFVDGRWPLTSTVASELGISLGHLHSSMPPYLKCLPNPEDIWATAIVLVWLTHKFANLKMELILILDKARQWLDFELNRVVAREELEHEVKHRLQIP